MLHRLLLAALAECDVAERDLASTAAQESELRGATIQVGVYIVGRTRCGELAGFHSISIAT